MYFGRMTARVVLSVAAALVALAVVERLDAGSVAAGNGRATCNPARVNFTPYPGKDGFLRRLPWVRGEPKARGLVGPARSNVPEPSAEHQVADTVVTAVASRENCTARRFAPG